MVLFMQTGSAQRAFFAFALPAVAALMSIASLGQAASAAEPAGALAFRPGETNSFVFDTGVLRGRLRPGGRGIGLSSVAHAASGLMLDRGDAGYGIFSHYRVFTRGRRYGGGAWDWPGTARLREDGAVEVAWAADTNRPFGMRAVYRWSAPDTLDLETIVEAQQDLPKFESFLASYFAGSFTNALVYTQASPAGPPVFQAGEKTLGDWLMFPRDAGALEVINDGRWQLQPNPVKWAVLSKLAAPISLRRDPASGVTVALMARNEDCFAIAMPHQTEGHYSVYLSLFGRDVKAGETARARARLLVLNSLAEGKILESQQAIGPAGRE